MRDRVVMELAELGFAIDLDGAGILAERTGEGAPLLLLAHLDTVWERGTLKRMPWRVENGRAYGPGAYDMKGGLVVHGRGDPPRRHAPGGPSGSLLHRRTRRSSSRTDGRRLLADVRRRAPRRRSSCEPPDGDGQPEDRAQGSSAGSRCTIAGTAGARRAIRRSRARARSTRSRA